jgi:hypothetical protein
LVFDENGRARLLDELPPCSHSFQLHACGNTASAVASSGAKSASRLFGPRDSSRVADECRANRYLRHRT